MKESERLAAEAEREARTVEMELTEIYRLISELIETAKPSSASSYEVNNMALRALIHAVQQEDCVQ